jgi:protein-S-isoprenylcysteine O-methyltransferase Ste14
VIWRWVPLCGFVLFVGLGFGWRSWLQRRRHGSAGIVMFQSGRLGQSLREAFFLVLVGAIAVESVLAAVAPETLARLGTVPEPVAAALRPVGAALVLLATALMVVAQLDLGASWRIGIEEGARPGLVTGGLYRFCRNPIFLFMLAALIGFAMLLPNWLSLVLALGGILGVRRHVHDEEAYLTRSYGDAYRTYAGRVGRFLPGIGRLG